MVSSNDIRQRYLAFFKDKQHAIIPSASLVPENDPTTLFTGSGMQPMITYLLGAAHPQGKRLADSQKCFRSQDIEEVGDNRHTTFFEMLGNWSLGDYFKQEQLEWVFAFLVDELGLDPHQLYVTVYGGDKQLGIPQDDETAKLWEKLFATKGIEAKIVSNASEKGMQDGRIFFYQGVANWWSRAGSPAVMPVGEPGGPDSEMFYDFGEDKGLHQTSEPCHVNCDCGRFLEIGNSVFMQYLKTNNGFESLPQKNIDFGGGLERILAAVNDEPDVFKIDTLFPIIEYLVNITGQTYGGDNTAAFRVIADHMRAAVMLIADGVLPDNKDQGYFVRRLIRRSVRYGKQLGVNQPFLGEMTALVADVYAEAFPEILPAVEKISNALVAEEHKFLQTLENGLKEFGKQTEGNKELTAQLAFTLYETYGFPLELSIEEAENLGLTVAKDISEQFGKLRAEHAAKSRTAAAGKFKGGLADHSETVVKYHTATHLLHAALRKILGDHVQQRGSNITGERLRFDFTHPQAMTEEEKTAVAQQINDWITADLTVSQQTMEYQAAIDAGALAFFGEKYPAQVKVYAIGDISMELCGGPHVSQTSEIGSVEISKEKSAAAGIRRVYLNLKNN